MKELDSEQKRMPKFFKAVEVAEVCWRIHLHIEAKFIASRLLKRTALLTDQV